KLSLVLRRRPAGHLRGALAGELPAREHDDAGDRAARDSVERRLLRPARHRAPAVRPQRLHVRLAQAPLAAGAVAVSRGAAGRAARPGRAPRIRPARVVVPGTLRVALAAADVRPHGARGQRELGPRTGKPAPDRPAALALRDPAHDPLSPRVL